MGAVKAYYWCEDGCGGFHDQKQPCPSPDPGPEDYPPPTWQCWEMGCTTAIHPSRSYCRVHQCEGGSCSSSPDDSCEKHSREE